MERDLRPRLTQRRADGWRPVTPRPLCQPPLRLPPLPHAGRRLGGCWVRGTDHLELGAWPLCAGLSPAEGGGREPSPRRGRGRRLAQGLSVPRMRGRRPLPGVLAGSVGLWFVSCLLSSSIYHHLHGADVFLRPVQEEGSWWLLGTRKGGRRGVGGGPGLYQGCLLPGLAGKRWYGPLPHGGSRHRFPPEAPTAVGLQLPRLMCAQQSGSLGSSPA